MLKNSKNQFVVRGDPVFSFEKQLYSPFSNPLSDPFYMVYGAAASPSLIFMTAHSAVEFLLPFLWQNRSILPQLLPSMSNFLVISGK